MKKQLLSAVGLLAFTVSGSVTASLVSVDVIAGPQHPDGLHDTWRVVARFSDAGDQISSVNYIFVGTRIYVDARRSGSTKRLDRS